jgi:uncharacterized protein
MIERRVAAEVAELLQHLPAVVLVGPRQAGKTTLALQLAAGRNWLAVSASAGRPSPTTST